MLEVLKRANLENGKWHNLSELEDVARKMNGAHRSTPRATSEDALRIRTTKVWREEFKVILNLARRERWPKEARIRKRSETEPYGVDLEVQLHEAAGIIPIQVTIAHPRFLDSDGEMLDGGLQDYLKEKRSCKGGLVIEFSTHRREGFEVAFEEQVRSTEEIEAAWIEGLHSALAKKSKRVPCGAILVVMLRGECGGLISNKRFIEMCDMAMSSTLTDGYRDIIALNSASELFWRRNSR